MLKSVHYLDKLFKVDCPRAVSVNLNIIQVRWASLPCESGESGETGDPLQGKVEQVNQVHQLKQVNQVTQDKEMKMLQSAHLSNDVVQLWFCEVLVHLLQDLTEPQHRNEPLSFTVKDPEKLLHAIFGGKSFHLSITWRPVSVHHMWGLRACPLQEGTSASSPLWHLLLPSLPLGPYKAPYLAPQWGTPLSFLAKAPCKHLLYAKEFIFCIQILKCIC